MDIVFVIDATGSMRPTLQAAREKVEDLAYDLHIHQRTADFNYGCICYRDPVDLATDVNDMFDIAPNAEDLGTWLEDIKAYGGGDGPEDFVGALNMLFDKITWREGPKNRRAVIWIADAPAHGRRYCGRRNHQEEEPKLEPLTKKLAEEGYYFVGLSLNGGADRTFREMKAIYEANGGKSFVVESFNPDPGAEVDAIAETMMRSTTTAVKTAFDVSDEYDE